MASPPGCGGGLVKNWGSGEASVLLALPSPTAALELKRGCQRWGDIGDLPQDSLRFSRYRTNPNAPPTSDPSLAGFSSHGGKRLNRVNPRGTERTGSSKDARDMGDGCRLPAGAAMQSAADSCPGESAPYPRPEAAKPSRCLVSPPRRTRAQPWPGCARISTDRFNGLLGEL